MFDPWAPVYILNKLVYVLNNKNSMGSMSYPVGFREPMTRARENPRVACRIPYGWTSTKKHVVSTNDMHTMTPPPPSLPKVARLRQTMHFQPKTRHLYQPPLANEKRYVFFHDLYIYPIK